MSYLSFEELVQVSGVASATLNRRLAFIKEKDPATYGRMLTKEGRTKFYESTILLPLLQEWKEYTQRIEQGEEAPPAEAPAPAKRLKARKQAAEPVKRPAPRKPAAPNPERQEQLTRLLEAPVVMVTPTPETMALYRDITDPVLRERMEYAILICDAYARGEVTLESACTDNSIPVRTFLDWRHQSAEISALFKRARAKHRMARRSVIGEVAQESLLRLVNFEEWDEVTTIYKTRLEPDGTETKIKTGEKVTRKRRDAYPVAVFFALSNAMKRLYQHRQELQLGPTTEQKNKDEIDRMTPEERQELLMQAMRDGLIAEGWKPPQTSGND